MWKWRSENAKIYGLRVEAGGVMEEDRGGVVGTLVCLSIWSIAIKINFIITLITKIIVVVEMLVCLSIWLIAIKINFMITLITKIILVVGTLVCLSIWSIAIKINLIIIKILPYIAHLRMAYWLGILSASIIRIAYLNYSNLFWHNLNMCGKYNFLSCFVVKPLPEIRWYIQPK